MTMTSPTTTQAFLNAFTQAPDRASAVRVFFDALAPHQDRIAATERRADQIFRFQTPDRPFIQFDVTDAAAGLEQPPAQWAHSPLDHTLAWQLMGMILTLDALPESDYVPMLNPSYGTSDLIPRMLGAEFDVMPDGACIPRVLLLHDLATDLPKLSRPDPKEVEPCRGVLDTCCFLVEATEGRLPIVYPQMQGPTTNAVRLMDQEDYLVACLTEPELVRRLSEHLTGMIIDISQAMWQAIGNPALARARQRGVQPAWVRGLLVDDYISVIKPDTYLEVARSSWQMMAEQLGPIFLHTCGPTLQCGEMLRQLPGLAGFETTFINGFSKTTTDLEAQKAVVNGQVAFQSFILPDNRTVQDEENLTADWLRRISAGGGFLLHTGGTAAEGRAFLAQMHAASGGN
jgi:hypothetical protein